MGVSCLEFTEDDVFCIGTNKPVSKLIGNRIWLIGGIGRPRKYYLCYYFLVDNIEPSEEGFRFTVSGQQGDFFKPPIFLNDFPWFKDFLKSQQNFRLGLEKIDKAFVGELEKVVVSCKQAQKVGGGFGHAETNQKIEQAAVSFVIEHYKQGGWVVKSVESEKCGFDLLCTKGELQEHVEVKGIQGDLLSFIVTSGEVRKSRSDNCFVLCIVTSVLSNPKLHKFTAKEFHGQFSLEAISYRATLKRGKTNC
jgi:hypothetical protein